MKVLETIALLMIILSFLLININTIYEIIKSKQWYKRMEEQHNKIMESLDEKEEPTK